MGIKPPLLTAAQLKMAMPNASATYRAKYLPWLNEGMGKYAINTKARIITFLAQVCHESGNLHYVEEIASGSAYENRRDLGNLTKEAKAAACAKGTTPGKFYKGHGLIQITGYYNHKECGEALGVDAVNNPAILTTDKYAALSAAWFFAVRGCNEFADVGDFKGQTRRINGGYNGLADRRLNLANAKLAYASSEIG